MPVIVGDDGHFKDVSDEEVATAEASKPEAPTQPAIMRAPDGKLYNVPATSINAANKNGWKVASNDELAHEKAVSDYTKENDSALGVFGTHFADEATLGVKEYIQGKEHTDEENAIREEGEKRLQEKHPIARWAGNIAGFAAPLLIPGVGEVGEAARAGILGEEAIVKASAEAAVKSAAEASLGRKIAANAAKYATEGAIYSAPKAAAQISYGDPEQAAETMLWGIGLSGIAGATTELAASATKTISEGAADLVSRKLTDIQPNGLSYVDDVARNIMGIDDKLANKPWVGPAKIKEWVQRGDELGHLKLDPDQRDLVFKALKASSGEKIGEHISKLDEHLNDPEIKSLMTSPMDVATELQTVANKEFPWINTSTHTAQRNELNKIIDDIHSYGNDPSFEKLHELRSNIGEGKKAFDSTTPQAKIYQLADNIIQKHMEEGAQKIYSAGKSPESFADYLQSKQDYHMTSSILQKQNPFKGTGRLPTNLATLFGHTTGAGAKGYTTAALVAGWKGVAANYVMKKIMSNKNIGMAVSTLRSIAKDPASAPILGSLLAKEGQSAFSRHLDSIPSFFTSKPTAVITVNAVKEFLGDEANGLSKEQQYKRATDKITALAADPNNLSDTVGKLASTFTGSSIQLASLVAQKKINAIQYLSGQIPKDPNPGKPFRQTEFKPTTKQIADFERKLAVIIDPMSVWNSIQNNTITKGEVEALQAVYPKLYQSMVQKAIETSYDPKSNNVSHQKRVALSKFTSMPLDPSLKNVSAIQSALNTPQTKPSSSPNFKHMPSLQTSSQRRTYK